MSLEKSTLSVVLATWSGTSELTEMAITLAKQVKPMCDELVITEDGHYSKELEDLADKYLLHERLGHGSNLNLGIQAAVGDFIAVLDSDIVLTKGSLRSLCLPGKVVSPGLRSLWGWFFVTPSSLIKVFPPFDRPGPEGIDHWWRAWREQILDVLVSSDEVEYVHLSNRSYDQFLKQRRQAEIEYQQLHPNKEVDPQRHKARLSEDSLYAKEWPE